MELYYKRWSLINEKWEHYLLRGSCALCWFYPYFSCFIIIQVTATLAGLSKTATAQQIDVVGCFVDDAANPTYSTLPGRRVRQTPAVCIDQCATNNFTHAMVQTMACLCGNGVAGLGKQDFWWMSRVTYMNVEKTLISCQGVFQPFL